MSNIIYCQMSNGCCIIGKWTQDQQLTSDMRISITIFSCCHEKMFSFFLSFQFRCDSMLQEKIHSNYAATRCKHKWAWYQTYGSIRYGPRTSNADRLPIRRCHETLEMRWTISTRWIYFGKLTQFEYYKGFPFNCFLAFFN